MDYTNNIQSPKPHQIIIQPSEVFRVRFSAHSEKFFSRHHTYGVNLDRGMRDKILFTTMNQWFWVKHYQETLHSVMLQMPHIPNQKLQIIALLMWPSFKVHSSAYHTGLSLMDW